MQLLILVMLALPCVLSVEISEPIVDVPGVGRFQGMGNLTSQIQKRNYTAFRGIEYAEPPVRFQPPVMRGKYSSTLVISSRFGPTCPQTFGAPLNISKIVVMLPEDERDEFVEALEPELLEALEGDGMISNIVVGKEDNCLTLNIYTPKIPSDDTPVSLPVIIFYYGGGFQLGGTRYYWAKRFMDQDIVLVTVNYRIGPIGFLCMQNEEAPGNAGMYDQLLGMKWVQKNIAYFGGDPDRITINGESAGSASISNHVLSPLSAGVFHGVIGESGSSLSSWAIDLEPVQHGLQFADFAGCKSGNNVTAATDCLFQMSTRDIINSHVAYTAQQELQGNLGWDAALPCVQEVAPAGNGKFLDRKPIDILMSGNFSHVPALYGNNRDEGSWLTVLMYQNFLLPHNLVNNSEQMKLISTPAVMEFSGITDYSGTTANSLMRTYFDGLDLSSFYTMVPGFTDILGAIMLKAPTYKQLSFYAPYLTNQTFFYSFEYLGGPSLYNISYSDVENIIPGGVAHGDELIFLYFPNILRLNANDTILSQKFIQMWTNFAYYGRPTIGEDQNGLDMPDWEPYSVENPRFLRIMDPFNLTMDTDFTKLWTIDKDTQLSKQQSRK